MKIDCPDNRALEVYGEMMVSLEPRVVQTGATIQPPIQMSLNSLVKIIKYGIGRGYDDLDEMNKRLGYAEDTIEQLEIVTRRQKEVIDSWTGEDELKEKE